MARNKSAIRKKTSGKNGKGNFTQVNILNEVTNVTNVVYQVQPREKERFSFQGLVSLLATFIRFISML